MKRKKLKRWVVKAGSNMICSGGPLLIRAWMQQVARLEREHNIEVVWVSSGAIATAVERTLFSKKKRSLHEKQALSAIGQPMVMDLYNIALNSQGLMGAQVLLTYDDLANVPRRKNFQNTIEQLLAWGITPILNENDAVATEEIRFGDNDSLSAKIAKSVKAERLVILTDVNGLYDSDPRRNPAAKLIPELKGVSTSLIKKIKQESGSTGGSSHGTGGMLSKLTAARLATQAKIETWLVKGDEPNILLNVAKNLEVGTRIRK